ELFMSLRIIPKPSGVNKNKPAGPAGTGSGTERLKIPKPEQYPKPNQAVTQISSGGSALGRPPSLLRRAKRPTAEIEAPREELEALCRAAPHYGRGSVGISATELQSMTFTPVRYVVPRYFGEGVTLLAGKPKSKKSWLVLDCAIAVST